MILLALEVFKELQLLRETRFFDSIFIKIKIFKFWRAILNYALSIKMLSCVVSSCNDK